MVDGHRLVHVSSSLFPSFFRCILCVRQVLLTMFLIFLIIYNRYPVVYIFPMMGISGSNAIVGIQLGYSVSDIISKCGVGLVRVNDRSFALAFVNIFVFIWLFSHATVFWRKWLYIRSCSHFLSILSLISTFCPEQIVDLPNHHREVSCAQEWKRRNSSPLVGHWLSW